MKSILRQLVSASLLLGVTAAGLAGATQQTAWRFGYHRDLGVSWRLASYRVYAPWKYAEWYIRWGNNPIIREQEWMVGAGLVGGLVGSLLVRVRKGGQATASTAYGSARWASKVDVKKTGMYNADTGIVLGVYDGKYLRHNGHEHALVFAPPGSGKTQGIIIPTLLTYSGPVVVLDIKGELWDTTAGWRDKHSYCIYYNPTDPTSARQNPLLEIRKGLNEVRDAGNIADILVDPEGSKDQLDHWEKNAHNLLIGGILHVLYAEEDKSLAGLAKFYADPAREFRETLEIMRHTCHVNGEPHPVVAGVAREMLNKSANELSGVVSTAMTFLGIYRDPLIARATSGQDFCLDQLLNPEVPWSLYLCLPASDISRLRPLFRLLLNQMGRKMTERLVPRKDRVLMVLDEFVALGHMDFYETTLAYMRGYWLRALMVVQSTNQLLKTYGQHQSIIDNCDIRVTMAANDGDTAKRIETLMGERTIVHPQMSYSAKAWSWWYTNKSLSMHEKGRALMTTAEILQMGTDKEVLFLTNQPPILAEKIQAWKDKTWTKRQLRAPGKVPRNMPGYVESPWMAEGPKPLMEEKV